jgi:transposase
MDQLIERSCGLDIYQAKVAACVRVPGPKGRRIPHVQTFGTTSPDLLALRGWLAAHGVTHVALETMGVYWMPVFYILEADFTCLPANAAPMKNVPGRKTDMADCAWLDP